MHRKKLCKRKKKAEVYDQEGNVMGKKKRLVGNSGPPDKSVLVSYEESSSNDNEITSLCVIKGK